MPYVPSKVAQQRLQTGGDPDFDTESVLQNSIPALLHYTVQTTDRDGERRRGSEEERRNQEEERRGRTEKDRARIKGVRHSLKTFLFAQ